MNVHPPIPATDASGERTTLGEYNGFEIYPMPFFVALVVDHPAAADARYVRALGFGVTLARPVFQ